MQAWLRHAVKGLKRHVARQGVEREVYRVQGLTHQQIYDVCICTCTHDICI